MLYSRRTRGFTLVELLVVIAIIGILVAMLLPAVQAAREAARRLQCSSNLKQIGLATMNYENTHGVYPPAYFLFDWNNWDNGHYFFTYILPYMEQQQIYDQYNFGKVWYSTHPLYPNKKATAVPIAAYQCPTAPKQSGTSDPNYPNYYECATDYAACTAIISTSSSISASIASGEITDRGDRFWRSILQPTVVTATSSVRETYSLSPDTVSIRDVTDGTSNSILLVETAGRPEYWSYGHVNTNSRSEGWHWADPQGWFWIHDTCYGGRMFNCNNNNEVYSFHPGGCQFLYGDGSVHFLPNQLNPDTFISLFTRAAGDLINED